MKRKILVSIHDVWPGNFTGAKKDLEWLRGSGVESVALMVVPFYHGKRNMREEPDFLAWLKEKQSKGSEIFMHGYRHLMSESLGEPAKRTLFGKWINGRVRNECEFAGLDPEQARDLLQKGLDTFAQSSLKPDGFTMPAWLGKVPRNFGWPESCRFFDGRFYVWDGKTGKCVWAPSLTFGRSDGSAPFAYGGSLWSAYLHWAKVTRISLHPGDLENASVRGMLEKTLRGRKPISYSRLFGGR